MAALPPRVPLPAWSSARVVRAFGLLAAAALAGFWEPYLAPLLGNRSTVPVLTHLHAASVALWTALLIAQPWLINTGRRPLHRRLGRVAWMLAPWIVISSLLLAVVMTRPAPGTTIEPFRYGLFFLQIGTSLLFALCGACALAQRHDMPLHARWMIASGITFIDPVFARVFAHLGPAWPWLVEYGSMVLADGVLLALIVAERRAPRGRAVFPLVLALMLVLQAGVLWIGDWAPWRRLLESAFS